MLAYTSTLSWIVDLNPFGHLFFKAMNAPCITVAIKLPPSQNSMVAAVLSKRTQKLPDKSTVERQHCKVKNLLYAPLD